MCDKKKMIDLQNIAKITAEEDGEEEEEEEEEEEAEQEAEQKEEEEEEEENGEKCMYYKQIVDSVQKYYYYIMLREKVVFLSSSNTLEGVKHLAIVKLGRKIEQCIGKKLIFVTVSNTYNKFKNIYTNELGLVGGPIAFTFMSGLVENRYQIRNEKEIGNNRYYLSDIYIQKNVDNISKNLSGVVKRYIDEYKTKNFMSVSIL